MAQPIPRQRSFISTLTTKSEIMVRGCCNRQILEDDIIYNKLLWVGLVCLYFLSTW